MSRKEVLPTSDIVPENVPDDVYLFELADGRLAEVREYSRTNTHDETRLYTLDEAGKHHRIGLNAAAELAEVTPAERRATKILKGLRVAIRSQIAKEQAVVDSTVAKAVDPIEEARELRNPFKGVREKYRTQIAKEQSLLEGTFIPVSDGHKVSRVNRGKLGGLYDRQIAKEQNRAENGTPAETSQEQTSETVQQEKLGWRENIKQKYTKQLAHENELAGLGLIAELDNTKEANKTNETSGEEPASTAETQRDRDNRRKRWIGIIALFGVVVAGGIIAAEHTNSGASEKGTNVTQQDKQQEAAKAHQKQLDEQNKAKAAAGNQQDSQGNIKGVTVKLMKHSTRNDLGTLSGIAYNQLQGTGANTNNPAVMAQAEKDMLANNKSEMHGRAPTDLPVGFDAHSLTKTQIKQLVGMSK